MPMLVSTPPETSLEILTDAANEPDSYPNDSREKNGQIGQSSRWVLGRYCKSSHGTRTLPGSLGNAASGIRGVTQPSSKRIAAMD